MPNNEGSKKSEELEVIILKPSKIHEIALKFTFTRSTKAFGIDPETGMIINYPANKPRPGNLIEGNNTHE